MPHWHSTPGIFPDPIFPLTVVATDAQVFENQPGRTLVASSANAHASQRACRYLTHPSVPRTDRAVLARPVLPIDVLHVVCDFPPLTTRRDLHGPVQFLAPEHWPVGQLWDCEVFDIVRHVANRC